MESLVQLQSALAGPRLDDDELRRVLEANLGFLERFAQAWQARAGQIDASLMRFVPTPTSGPMDISALTFPSTVCVS